MSDGILLLNGAAVSLKCSKCGTDLRADRGDESNVLHVESCPYCFPYKAAAQITPSMVEDGRQLSIRVAADKILDRINAIMSAYYNSLYGLDITDMRRAIHGDASSTALLSFSNGWLEHNCAMCKKYNGALGYICDIERALYIRQADLDTFIATGCRIPGYIRERMNWRDSATVWDCPEKEERQ